MSIPPISQSQQTPVQIGVNRDGIAFKLTPQNQNVSYQTTLAPERVSVYRTNGDTTSYASIDRTNRVQIGIFGKKDTCVIL